jgi:predicted RNase H-like HicB family nuclease
MKSAISQCLWYNSNMTTAQQPITVELIPDPDLGGFTARVPDIPAYGEGETEEAAIADLREALRGYIETFGLQEALSRMIAPSSLRKIDWDFAELARG